MTELGELLADGRTSQVYRYGHDGAAKLLKPSTPQHWVEIEASFTDAVGRLGIPAPEVRDVIEIDGRVAIVFGRIDGRSMWQCMIDRPTDIGALTSEMVAIQRDIHSAGVPDGLPSLVDRLGNKIDNADALTAEERGHARSLLAAMPVGAAVLHGDLHPGNIIIGPRGAVVIDWFDATVGHPTADIARSELLVTARGATDLRHLPGHHDELVSALHRAYLSNVGESEYAASWRRLRAVGRLAERADHDPSGLLATWHSGSAVDDH